MDDPWGNAWGEPSTTTTTHDTWDVKPVTTLTTSPPLGDEEADLGGASAGWTLDGAVRWDEGDAWGSSNSAWQPQDTFSNIKLETPVAAAPPESEPEPDLEPERPDSEHASEPEPEPEEEVDEPPPVTVDAPPDTDEEAPAAVSAPRTPDPDADGFGTFDDGTAPVSAAAAPWSPVAPAFPEDTDGGWGTSAESAWGAADPAEKEEEAEEEDEWTRAARAKAALDRALPPELLASIMQQVQELADAAWPPQEGDHAKDTPPDWASSWLAGMDGVPGLESLLSTYVPPDHTLPPPTRFAATHTSKSLSSSLKLTRHTLPARNSPFASLMAARGSAAWEAAVKARSMPTADADAESAVPAGWRILEKDERKDGDAKEEGKEEKRGLFASLWGRRSSTMKPQTTGGSIGSSGSTRQSVEVLSPVSAPSTGPATPQRAASPAPSTTSTPAPTASTPTAEAPPAQPAPYDPPTFEPILPPSSSASPPPQAAPAPTGVSRFFSRLTRNRASSPSPRASLALSGDDIEFLGDIVPSASDPDDENDLLGLGGGKDRDLKMAGLESLLKSKPIGGKLPAPLPPPPSVPTLRPVSSASAPKPHHASQPSQDLFAGFDVLQPSSSGGTQASGSANFQALPTSSSLASTSAQPFAPSISTASSAQPLAPSTSSSAFDDDDDFADFLGSPSAHTGPSAAGGLPPAPDTSTFGDFSSFAAPSASSAAGQTATSDSFGDFGGFMSTPVPSSAATVASPPQPLAPPPSAISTLSPPPRYGTTPVLPPPGSSTISPLPPPQSVGTATPPLPPPSAGMSKSLLDRRLSRPVGSSGSNSPVSPAAPAPLARAGSVKNGKPLSITPPSLDLFNTDASSADKEDTKSGVEASHTRTRSLLESAQARAGMRWPAPPSPLPEALSPPPDAPATFTSAGVDLLGVGSGLSGFAAAQVQGAPPVQTFSPPSRALSPPMQTLSPPPLAPPPGANPPAHKIPPAPLNSLAPPTDLFDMGTGVEETPPPTPPKPDFGSFARSNSRPSSVVGSSTFSPPSNPSPLPPSTLSPPNSSTLPSAVGISRFPHHSSLPVPASTSRPASRAAHKAVTMSGASTSAGGSAPLLPPPPGGGSPFAPPPRAPSVVASPPPVTMTPPTASLSPPAGFAPPQRNSFASPPPMNPSPNNVFAALPPGRAMSLSPPARDGSPDDSVPLAALVQQRHQAQTVVKGTGGLSAQDLSFFEGL
ncbi:unnamed protein product [Peniophora sp. CBMAI 1063]|nr:unnamed protein product [Peniophora sp. CBMAI 1063]